MRTLQFLSSLAVLILGLAFSHFAKAQDVKTEIIEIEEPLLIIVTIKK